VSPDDSSSVSIYENFENSLRDSNASDTDFEGSTIEGGNGDCDTMTVVIQEQGDSETECPHSDNFKEGYSGVFTIKIPTHHLIQEEPPCIMIETNSHSEA
jgi:hypothetical protein